MEESTMEDKPILQLGFICPVCKSTDSVALMTHDAYIHWCSCGKVFTCEFGAIKEVYEFGRK